MRWYVEVSRIGESGVAEEYCVAAKQWQAALQEARKLRGDGGALAQFSIELLDHGYRAVDPTLKLRYLVTQAPETAKLTGSSTNLPAPHAPSVAPSVSLTGASSSLVPRPSSLTPPRPVSLAPQVSQTPGAQQLLVPDDPVPPPPASVGPPLALDSAAAPAPLGSLNDPPLEFELVRERSEEPRTDSPITYRELAFAVAPSATRSQVEALLNDRYRETLAAIADRPPGKFVQLAVFDHVFKRRPERPPLATFAWKDWRGAPVMAFPGFGGEPLGPMSQVPPAPIPSSLPPSNGVHSSVAAPADGSADLSLLPPPASLAPSSGASSSATSASTMPTSLTVASVVPTSSPPSSGSLSPSPMVKLESPVAAPGASADPLAVVAEAAPSVVAPALVVAELAPVVTEAAPVSAVSAPSTPEPTVLDAASSPIVESAAPSLESAAPSEAASFGAEPSAPSSGEPAVVSADAAPVVAAPTPPALEFDLNFETPFNAAQLAAPVLKSAPGNERVSRPRVGIVGRRRAGEDLISELFEYMHELHFQRDVATGADFVLSVLDEVLPCEGVLIHVFDINTGHFVIVRAKGPNASSVLLQRMSDQDPFALSVMRSPRSISVPNAATDARFNGPRWQAVGVAPKSALCGAVHQGGRYLGLIELVNPQGDTPFHFSELNALDYICEQFADFLSKKPVVLAADVVLAHV